MGNTMYAVNIGGSYAIYNKGIHGWRESASVTNEQLKDKGRFKFIDCYYYKIDSDYEVDSIQQLKSANETLTKENIKLRRLQQNIIDAINIHEEAMNNEQ